MFSAEIQFFFSSWMVVFGMITAFFIASSDLELIAMSLSVIDFLPPSLIGVEFDLRFWEYTSFPIIPKT